MLASRTLLRMATFSLGELVPKLPSTVCNHPPKTVLPHILSAPLPARRNPLPIRTAVDATDAVAELRRATHALHERLDSQLPLGRQAPSLADYATHLRVLRDWQQALAPWLSRTASMAGQITLLAQDLEDCPPCCLPAAYVRAADLDVVLQVDDGSEAFCWGIAYVLEGSRLGGQVLYKRLHERLAPHPLRYLQHGTGGPSWSETLKTLRAQLVSPPSQAAACRGAVAAFELLLARFELAGVTT